MLTRSSVEQGRVTIKKEAASPVNLSNRGTHHRQTCRVPIHVTGRPAGRLFTSSADLPGGRTVSSADLPNRPAGHRSSRDLPAPVITPRQLPLPEWSREYSIPVLQYIVLTAAHQSMPIRGECHAEHPTSVSSQHLRQFTGASVPDIYRL